MLLCYQMMPIWSVVCCCGRCSDFNYLGKTSKKIKCIFYDIVLKGRGVKDQNQISEKIWNYDKGFKGGRWKNLMSQIHLSNILFIMCIKQQYSHINVKILYSFQVMTFIVHFFTLIWVFVITNNILKTKLIRNLS